MDKEKLEKIKKCGKERSPLWEKTKKDFAKNNPKICAICERKIGVQLHHIRPFHLHPELELDPTNLIWLCENNKDVCCHLVFGHFGNFRTKFNPTIRIDAKTWNERITRLPEGKTK